MAAQPPTATIQLTGLVQETWLKLAGEQHHWWNREHFFCVAAEAMMQRIMVDRARGRLRLKRYGGNDRKRFSRLAVGYRTCLTAASQQARQIQARWRACLGTWASSEAGKL